MNPASVFLPGRFEPEGFWYLPLLLSTVLLDQLLCCKNKKGFTRHVFVKMNNQSLIDRKLTICLLKSHNFPANSWPSQVFLLPTHVFVFFPAVRWLSLLVFLCVACNFQF
jgi:hypothetical protein